jgi:hypothetical protein
MMRRMRIEMALDLKPEVVAVEAAFCSSYGRREEWTEYPFVG